MGTHQLCSQNTTDPKSELDSPVFNTYFLSAKPTPQCSNVLAKARLRYRGTEERDTDPGSQRSRISEIQGLIDPGSHRSRIS